LQLLYLQFLYTLYPEMRSDNPKKSVSSGVDCQKFKHRLEPNGYFMSRFDRQILVLLLALAGLQGCGWSPFGTKEEYLHRAQQFAERGQYGDSVLQYRKALQKDGNYGEAYLRYGQLLARLNRQAQAFSSLSRAVELLPQSEEARAELGRLAMIELLRDPRRPQRLYQTADKMATELLAANPNSAEGLRLKGYLALVDSHSNEVIDYFNRSLLAKPNQPDVVTMLVQTLLLEHQGDEAEKVVRSALATLKNDGPLYDTLYGYYMGAHRPADGEQLLKLKIANNPRDVFFVVQLASHYRNQRETEQMEAVLKAFVADTRNYPSAPRETGDFYRRIGRLEDAVALWQKGVQSDPSRKKEYLQRIVAVRLAQGRTQDATAAVDAILKDFPGDVTALAARADLRMAGGRPDEMEKATRELADLVKKAPANNDIRYSLANAWRQTGHEAEARVSLLEILQRDPKHRDALREMADISIRDLKPDEALQYADRLLAIDPDNTGARLVRTSALALRGRFSEVRSELRRMTREKPDLPEPWLQMATLDMEQKNYPEAEQILRRLVNQRKGDIRPLKGLVFLLLTQGQPQEALALVRDESAASADPQVKVLLITTAAQIGNFNMALPAARKLVADFPDNPDHLMLLGEIYQRAGQLDQAIASFQTARDKDKDSPIPASHLAEALAQAGRSDEAIAASRHALQMRPNDPLLQNALAWHLATGGKNLDEASALAHDALQKMPGHASFIDTSGMVYLKSGKLDLALRTFQQLVLRDPSSPTYRTHLATTLIAQGDQRRARAELETALRNRPSPVETQDIRKLLKGVL
jgi:tetratricopeptide (TPR) repeat protein